MGLFGKVFRKKKTADQSGESMEVLFDSGSVDFRDEEQRSRYVMSCIEQIAEADRESEKLTAEYSRVTGHLSDMEKIEALPPGEAELLAQNARMIYQTDRERQRYLGKKNRMSDLEYQTLQSHEDTVAEGIAKLSEAEKYAGLIKQDLRKLDIERQAYSYRQQELEQMLVNYRGMVIIFVIALGTCLGLLTVMRFVFDMDTYIGYFVAMLAGALAISLTGVKYMDAQGELKKIKRAISRLIQLQNKVKIRYVNNTNLLEYLRMKYNTKSAKRLRELWSMYQKESEERRQFAEAEAKVELYRERLVEQLASYHIREPGRWIRQTAAILDKREMVELRHELIKRRQALRKQLDYNRSIADNAHREILDLVNHYPAYRMEILEMVDKYRQESERIS